MIFIHVSSSSFEILRMIEATHLGNKNQQSRSMDYLILKETTKRLGPWRNYNNSERDPLVIGFAILLVFGKDYGIRNLDVMY